MTIGSDKRAIRREICRTVFRAFELKGWSKARKNAIYKVGDGVSGVVAMEPAKYSTRMEVDIGFWFPEDPSERLLYYKCPVFFPLIHMYPKKRELIYTALCQEQTNPECLAHLTEFLELTVVEEISGLLSKDKLREILSGDRLLGARIFQSAREALDM